MVEVKTKVLFSNADITLSELNEGEFAIDDDGNIYVKLFVPNLAAPQPFCLNRPNEHNFPSEAIEVRRLRKGDAIVLTIEEEPEL